MPRARIGARPTIQSIDGAVGRRRRAPRRVEIARVGVSSTSLGTRHRPPGRTACRATGGRLRECDVLRASTATVAARQTQSAVQARERARRASAICVSVSSP